MVACMVVWLNLEFVSPVCKKVENLLFSENVVIGQSSS